MPIHEHTLLVPYSTEEMFDLAVDVERYPEFLPGYSEARVVRIEKNVLYTTQRVGFGLAQVNFRSEAHLDRPRKIDIRSVEWPFDLLHIEWTFTPAPEGCRISFRACIQLGGGLAQRVLQNWFDRLADLVPAAFARRAKQLYGQRPGPGPT